jgi:hypothetical protein
MIVETSLSCSLYQNQATELSEDELRSLSTSGFVTTTAISSLVEVAEIRRVVMDLLARRAGEKEGVLFDTLESPSSPDVRRSIQLTNPSHYQSWLLETEYVRNATRIAHQVLSPECSLTCDFVLLKPARVGAGTPWHQDEAYSDPRYDHSTLTFWMPLQDVGPNDGCMVYLPGSHLMGALEHRSLNGDPQVHAFECATTFPQEQVVACPLPAGGCAIHGQRTLHCSRNNESSVDRYAYLLAFGTLPTLAKSPRNAPWLEQRQSKEQRTRRAWMRKGGVFVVWLRKMRRLRSLTPSMYLVYLKRSVNTIFGYRQ